MKVLVGMARIFVGILFIISGFVKLNDPIGFSFKLQEYFGAEVLNLEFLIPFALVIAIVIVIFELVLGIMLLIGYLPKFTLWSLLIMILFFTFLTFYSAYFHKVLDCGCFGDAIPLSPWQSFSKDVVLLLLILLLFFNSKYLTPVFAPSSHKWIVFLSFMASFIFCYYVLMHLPLIDFRAYKVGTNLLEEMKLPEDAQKAVYDYEWKFNKDGKDFLIKNSGEFPQVDGEYIGVDTKLVKEGDKPKIKDFFIEKDGINVTEEILSKEKLLIIIAYNLSKTEKEGFGEIKKLSDEALAKGYTVIGLTSSGENQKRKITEEFNLSFDFYQSDETVLKTIARSNPAVLLLNGGTVKQKKHWFDTSDIQL
jgi:uncharacterized membrane protein YphA (DoxX/SURF4 family)